MEVALALVIVVLLAVFVIAPLRGRRAGGAGDGESPELTDLEARKEALYRQIRDAELDREQGKLSPADWERLDSELRLDAIAVLKRIDAIGGRGDRSV
jgi:hypothetical protein